MQMVKKSVALFLSLLMVMSMLTVAASVTAFAADDTSTVTIKSQQNLFADVTKSVKVGDEIAVTVKAQADKIAVNGEMYINYDSSALKIKGTTPILNSGSVAIGDDGSFNFSNAGLEVSQGGGYDFTTETKIYTTIFTVKKAVSATITVDTRTFTLTKNNPKITQDDIYVIEGSEVNDSTGYKISVDVTVTEGTEEPSDPAALEGDYYLVGYINGKNHGDDSDSANLGDYHFVNGKVTAGFSEDSYVCVKTADNQTWYMTDGWLGTSVTSAKLYKAPYGEKAPSGEEFNKLYVPKGDEVTFTLVENSDGTLTLSYEKTGNTVPTESESSETPSSSSETPSSSSSDATIESDVYLLGTLTGIDWDNANAKNLMTAVDSDTFTKTLTLAAGTYDFKINSAGVWYGNNGTIKDTTEATSSVGWVMDGSDNCKLEATGGEYTFKYVKSTNTIFVTYKSSETPSSSSETPSSSSEMPSSGSEGLKGDYYLVGYINGKNHGDDSDSANLGDYHFVNGKVTAGFSEDSYVCVKTADNQTWYMTDGWLGTSVTSAKLYKAPYGEKAPSGEDFNKLYVPKGDEVTFTLVENSDGTLTLSYEKTGNTVPTEAESSETPSSSSEDSSSASTSKDYYLVGYLNKTDVGIGDDAANLGTNKFVNGKLTFTVTDDTYVAVKAADGTTYWTEGWLGFDTTSATLTSTPTDQNKLYVPKGEVTFTVSENSDGTVTLSYTVKGSETPSSSSETPSSSSGDTTEYTFYFVPTSADVEAGDFFTLNAHVNGAGADDWTFPRFAATSEKYTDGRTIYMTKTTVPTDCEFDTLQYQVYSDSSYSTWVRQYVDTAAKVTDYADKLVVAGEDDKFTTEDYKGETPSSSSSSSGDAKFYLFGYINGADYACADDSDNLGEYKFDANGKLTTTFDKTSYVAVKSGDNQKWYMTNDWQGEVNSATLYETKVYNLDGVIKDNGEALANKLYVPGGVEVTFTLVDNGDDSLELSYTVNGEVPSSSSSESGEIGDFYLFGKINGVDNVGEGTDHWQELTDYKFDSNGKLTTTFTEDSYVAVKSGDLQKWYMTNDWQGFVDSVTLYETKVYNLDGVMKENGEALANKLYVPGGVEVTFTLVDNGDDSLELSYVINEPDSSSSEEDSSSSEPVSESSDSSSESTSPSTDPSESTQPSTPSQSTDPSESTQPSTPSESTTPSSESQPSSVGPDVPSTPGSEPSESTTPSSESVPTLPSTDTIPTGPSQPSTSDSEPSSDTTAPTTDAPEPSSDTTAPTTDAPEPSSDTTAPTTEPEPSSDTTAPTTEPEPSSDTTAPTTAPSTPAPTTKPTEPTTKATQPTTATPSGYVGPGAPISDVSKNIGNLPNDKDPSGSVFSGLQAKAKTVAKKSITVSWKKIKGAKTYYVFSNKCGRTNGKINPYKLVKKTTKLSYKRTGLKAGTYYKFLIVAVDKNGKTLSTSKTIHVATKGGKVGNPKKVTITNAKSTKKIKKGKTFTLKTKVTPQSKKLKVKTHRKVVFESTNTKVATVTKKGKITGKKKGTATIYAYAQNGVATKIKVKIT